MGLTAYPAIELSCSFSNWFTPKSLLKLTLEPLQYLCHHPQEPVYVSLPLDTHPFVFLRYRDCIPDKTLIENKPRRVQGVLREKEGYTKY